MRAVRPVAAAAMAAALVAGCSGGPSGDAPAAPQPSPSRWWSESQDYCGMLAQTVAGGKSILAGVATSDPALLRMTTAFVTDIQHAAPPEVADAWQVIGPAVVELVKSGGQQTELPSSTGVEAVQRAAADIGRDAQRRCDLQLSRE